MHPHEVLGIPFHPLVHLEDERTVLLQALEAFGARTGVIEIRQRLVGEGDLAWDSWSRSKVVKRQPRRS
jgi:hypothetical protein